MSARSEAERDFDDPLAARVGMFVGVDDLPPDGWPDAADPATIERILRLLPGDAGASGGR